MFNPRESAPGQRGARIRAALLIAMPLVALAPKYWIITHSLYSPSASVFQTSFGFGGYIHSLMDGGGFRSCTALPFTACDPAACTSATRMPGIPLLLAGLANLIGTQSASVALAKSVLLALLTSGFLAVLTRDVRVTTLALITFYGLYFGPEALKHGAAIDYEEGVLVDLSMCLAVALCYVIRPTLTASSARRAAMAYAAVAIAAAMYFIKTTALLTLVVALVMMLTGNAASRIGKAACIGAVVVLSALWAIHNWASSGAIHLSSSWNGENLVRGYDSGAFAIYPEISLDRIFSSKWAKLDDGTLVPLGDYNEQRCFRDEWDWNSAYSAMAREWLVSHPLPAVLFTARKIWVTLFEIRHTPKYISATSKDEHYSAPLTLAMEGWMIAARVLFFVLIGRVLLEVIKRRNLSHLWVLAILLAACAPYMLVFGYERHMIPVLLLAGGLFATLFLTGTR